jgi:hypothetical protein
VSRQTSRIGQLTAELETERNSTDIAYRRVTELQIELKLLHLRFDAVLSERHFWQGEAEKLAEQSIRPRKPKAVEEKPEEIPF